jgi:uncharacterized caspase-like protein
MASRRQVLRALAAIPAAYSVGSWSQAEPATRLALVIGNSGYRSAPLPNPVNDAKAVAATFISARVSVSSYFNLTRAEMLMRLEEFAVAAARETTREVYFYYAGHGVQLDWRNYLLPVDAEVANDAEVRARCVDLAAILTRLAPRKDRTFVLILDACRNDPFGSAYRPAQRGLSQFDAPPGSLLAYATSPGSVASDGAGSNGLYTEHLVRELSVRGARIEDVFKKVRLNVRLASGGAQIPWETTSLESDVYLFEDGKPKLSPAELEKQLEEDIAAWDTIRNSRKAEDWIDYLRRFPNGRFAEMAQGRLARLLSGAAGAGAATAAAPVLPRVQTEEDYEKLPKGATYLDPNGKMRRKTQ